MEFCDLIKTPKLENVILHSQLKDPIVGSFCLTFSHIIFSSRKENSEFELWVSLKKKIEGLSSDTLPHFTAAASKYRYS